MSNADFSNHPGKFSSLLPAEPFLMCRRFEKLGVKFAREFQYLTDEGKSGLIGMNYEEFEKTKVRKIWIILLVSKPVGLNRASTSYLRPKLTLPWTVTVPFIFIQCFL